MKRRSPNPPAGKIVGMVWDDDLGWLVVYANGVAVPWHQWLRR